MMRNNFFGSAGLLVFIVFFVLGMAPVRAFAEDADLQELSEMVRKAWEASSHSDQQAVDRIVISADERFSSTADSLHSSLKDFPARDVVESYKLMNDLAVILFVQAEALMNAGRSEEAVEAFKKLIARYPFAQSWDPSRGSYWSIAQKSQESVNKLTGVEEENPFKNVPRTTPQQINSGTDVIIDYSRYGAFSGVGTKDYDYKVNNPNVLAKAVGEGLYPNTSDIYLNSHYKEAVKVGRMEGSQWDFVNTPDLGAAYFKWTTAPESWGVKLFYIGMIFEKAGQLMQAIKAYHALAVHFPRATAWTYWKTPWYPAQAAIGKINFILRLHPELRLELRDANIEVLNSSDNDPNNDVFIVSPGQLVSLQEDRKPARVKLARVKRKLGGRKTELRQYANGHWQMFVNGKPFIIKGMTYTATKIGQSPDKGTLENWMFEDSDNNGRIDGPYDAWVDADRNNVQDEGEDVVGDFELMKRMGVNTIREYHHHDVNKELLRAMHKDHGIMVIMGDFLGKYTLGSGASWTEGTDYENPKHREAMLASVEKMVRDFKDEPYILLWLLGNENNYGVASNADKKPEAYYKFVNEVARLIKRIDPDRPVAMCNGDVLYLDIFAKNASDVDIFAANVYRGDYGFGPFWMQVKRATAKPAFITEYGSPAYAQILTLDEAEAAQAAYHRGNWLDILENSAGYAQGAGNAIGGVAFEWMDEWWKNYEPYYHDKKADVIGPFVGGYYFEEWFGLIGQGNGRHSPFMRQLRQSYGVYQQLWNEK